MTPLQLVIRPDKEEQQRVVDGLTEIMRKHGIPEVEKTKCDKCGGPVRTYNAPAKGGPIQVECMACGWAPENCVCKDRIRISARVHALMEKMSLGEEPRERVEKVYTLKANLGEYEGFLAELKGKRYRRMLYGAIEEDICRYIWHHDWKQSEEMPEGFRP